MASALSSRDPVLRIWRGWEIGGAGRRRRLVVETNAALLSEETGHGAARPQTMKLAALKAVRASAIDRFRILPMRF